MVGVRLSVFDMLPYQQSDDVGSPMSWPQDKPYHYGFGNCIDNPMQIDLDEPLQLLKWLQELGVIAVNLLMRQSLLQSTHSTASYLPAQRWIPTARRPTRRRCRQFKPWLVSSNRCLKLPLVGTGYTYLQDYLPNVAQAAVREKMTDLWASVAWCSPIRPCPRHSRRQVTPAQIGLPNIQRLHHSPTQWNGQRLLSARRVLTKLALSAPRSPISSQIANRLSKFT